MTDEQRRQERGRLERRRFLKGLGLAAGGAAAAAAPAGAAAAAEGRAEAAEEQVKPRYRETEEVKRFYALNRL